MNNEKIIIALASIVGFLLVSTVSLLGWIAVKVWDMNPTVTETARRVDRIVQALPEVKVRIAMEDLERNFGAAILTTEPVETEIGKWQAFVHYLDFEKGIQNTYVTSLNGSDDQMTSLTVAGLVTRTAREKLSLQDFAAASYETNKPTVIPSVLDSTSSYVILRSHTNYDQQLRKLLGKPIRQVAIVKGQIKWEGFTKQLNSKQAQLLIKTPQASSIDFE